MLITFVDQRPFVKVLLWKTERDFTFVWYFYGTWWVGWGWLWGRQESGDRGPTSEKLGVDVVPETSFWRTLEPQDPSFSSWIRLTWWIELSVCIPSWLPSYLEVLSEDAQYGQGGRNQKNWSMKNHEATLNASYKIWEVNLKRLLCTVWFQLHNMLEKAELWGQ